MKILESTENLIEMIGCHHRYQIIVSIIFFLLGMMSDSSLNNLPMMAAQPMIDHFVDGKLVTETLTYDICKKGNFKVNVEKSTNNWLFEFEDVRCNKTLVSLLTTFFYSGEVIGLFALQFFKNNSKESLLKIISFIFISSNALLLIKSYYAVLIFNFIQGLSQTPIAVLRFSTITELTCVDYRSYFLNVQFLSALISPSYLLLMRSYGVDWRYTYYLAGIVMLIANLINCFVVVTNPRFLMVNYEIDEATESAEYIRSFNRLGHHNEVADVNDILDPNTSQVLIPESVSISVSSILSGDKEQLPSKAFLFNIFVMMVCGVVNVSLVMIEQKKVVNEPNFLILYLVGSYLSVGMFIFIGWLMNTVSFGRRYTLLSLNLLIITVRLIEILWSLENNLAIYCLACMFTICTQVPSHTITMESFSNKGRLKYYGLLYLFSKVFQIACPSIYEYTPEILYLFLIITLSGLTCSYLVFLIEETNKKKLKDF